MYKYSGSCPPAGQRRLNLFPGESRMRKRELFRRGFALLLALTMLMEAAPSFALTAYAEDELEEQVEASAQPPNVPETPDVP